MKGLAILAIDIETDGAFISNNSMIAVGIAAVDLKDGSVIRNERICFKQLDGREPEERCMKEFWSHHSQVYEKLIQEGEPAISASKKLADAIDRLEHDWELIIVSDNPAFDFAWINYYFSLFLQRLPLSYGKDGRYRMLYDSDSYAKATIKGLFRDDCGGLWNSTVAQKLDLEEPKQNFHFPEEDALCIATFFRQVYLKNVGAKL